MRILGLLTVLLVATSAAAEPFQLDLAPERAEYESKVHARTWGLSLLAGTLVLGGVSAFSYLQASSTRSELLAQRPRIDLTRRQQLVSQGQTYNGLGLGAAIAGVGTALASAYFLTGSF